MDGSAAADRLVDDPSHEQRDAVLRGLAPAPTPSMLARQLEVLACDPAYAFLPYPGAGATLRRWQVLSEVAAHDLALVKFYEGHADALAILHELGSEPPAVGTWAVWAAEPPGERVIATPVGTRQVRLQGRKPWCSGAGEVAHALVTAWHADGAGPYLVRVDMRQAGIGLRAEAWQAVGMAGSASFDVEFHDAAATLVGERGDYVQRPGFMQGGAGIAACWYGGAMALGEFLRRAVAAAGPAASPFRAAALGRVDLALAQTAALLREAAHWIDAHPRADCTVHTLRVRQSADACARSVLDEVGRALGATPYCRDRRFARLAADLPVFTRQSLAERDLQALGARLAADTQNDWRLLPGRATPGAST